LRLGSIFQADRNSFHLVVANITAEELIGLSRDLAGAILPGGRAILSGILVEKKAALEKVYLELGLRKQDEIVEDRWVTQVWEKSG
jgi:ribosomal protein L11 methyltransferase